MPPFTLDSAMKVLDAAALWVFPCLLEGIICSEMIVFASERSGLAVTEVIVFTNLAVYCVWQLAKVDRYLWDMGLWNCMKMNFVMPYDTKELAARPQTILLSSFSQKDRSHLDGNVIGLLTFARNLTVDDNSLISVMGGSRQFSYFYLSSIYFSTAFEVYAYLPMYRYVRSQVMRRLQAAYRENVAKIEAVMENASLGSSGAVAAVRMLFCLTFPDAELSAGNETTIQAKVLGQKMVLGDLIPAIQSLIGVSKIAHGAHLGGQVYAALYHGVRETIRRVQSMPMSMVVAESAEPLKLSRSRLAYNVGSCLRW